VSGQPLVVVGARHPVCEPIRARVPPDAEHAPIVRPGLDGERARQAGRAGVGGREAARRGLAVGESVIKC
jgi:hypothetical protein